MSKVYPPCKDHFGKKIRGAIVYGVRTKRLVWNGRILPERYFLLSRY